MNRSHCPNRVSPFTPPTTNNGMGHGDDPKRLEYDESGNWKFCELWFPPQHRINGTDMMPINLMAVQDRYLLPKSLYEDRSMEMELIGDLKQACWEMGCCVSTQERTGQTARRSLNLRLRMRCANHTLKRGSCKFQFTLFWNVPQQVWYYTPPQEPSKLFHSSSCLPLFSTFNNDNDNNMMMMMMSTSCFSASSAQQKQDGHDQDKEEENLHHSNKRKIVASDSTKPGNKKILCCSPTKTLETVKKRPHSITPITLDSIKQMNTSQHHNNNNNTANKKVEPTEGHLKQVLDKQQASHLSMSPITLESIKQMNTSQHSSNNIPMTSRPGIKQVAPPEGHLKRIFSDDLSLFFAESLKEEETIPQQQEEEGEDSMSCASFFVDIAMQDHAAAMLPWVEVDRTGSSSGSVSPFLPFVWDEEEEQVAKKNNASATGDAFWEVDSWIDFAAPQA